MALREGGSESAVATVSTNHDEEETRLATRAVEGTVSSLDAAGISVNLENGIKAIISWGELHPDAHEKMVSPLKPGQRIRAAVKPNGNGNGLLHLSPPFAILPPEQPHKKPRPKKQDVPPVKKAVLPQLQKFATLERARAAIAIIFLVAFAILSMVAIAGWVRRSRPSANNPAPVVSNDPPAETYVPQVGDEAETTTDVNIREKHSARSRKVGLAEKGSRVRVLEVHRNWRRILVLAHGREKADEDSEDQGWIDADNLKRADGS
jgi:hypothetical protein